MKGCILFILFLSLWNGFETMGTNNQSTYRQFSPGIQGVGEVQSVDADEYAHILRNHSDHGDVTTEISENNTDLESNGSAANDSLLDNIQPHLEPQVIDKRLGYEHVEHVELDRRKGSGDVHEQTNDDLSFSGLLNGLLDSFINTPDPPLSQPRQTTPQPRSPVEEIEEDEEEEEEEDAPIASSTPGTVEETSNEEDVSETPLDDSVEQNSTIEIPEPPKKVSKPCGGECRNIIFGLFLCDEIDNDAFCSEPGLACCVNNPEEVFKPDQDDESTEVVLDNDHETRNEGTQNESEEPENENENSPETNIQKHRPVIQQQQPPPQPPRYPSHFNRVPYPPQSHYYYPQNTPSPVMVHQPRMPLPCPRYCVKSYLESYCSDRLPSQFACGVDGFCCAHDVTINSNKNDSVDANLDEEEDSNVFTNESSNDQDNTSPNKILGPCTEEVGSCVSTNIVSIICFGHATPTDMYTCPRNTMKCCARKTALPKESLPPTTTTTPPPRQDPITRNTSSYVPNIPPQFPPTQQFGNKFPHPTPPPSPILAETPPPPHAIPTQQFGSQVFSNSIHPTRNPPPRQPIGSYVCGVKGVPTVSKRRRKKRVVGGSDSLPGEWCWQVALINSLNQYLCGGALIGTQWVLTAAHCVTNIVRSGDAIYVRVGDHDLTSRYGSPGAQTLRVATTYIHHNHNSQTLDNDIALLKLQGNAALKEGVCLVCLPSRNHMSEMPGKRCTVTGYGYMGESGPIPLRIREASLPIVSETECVSKVNAVTEKVFALPMSSFCAGGELRNDACQGDGGGPLVCRADDPNTGDSGTGYYELTGLVSWGFGCGRENVPGVYVKVSSFIGWIHQIIRSN
ncbi:unnamed protein product [Orchesella dallaii]|uniref:Peptidase S1 domain-containing protein n=2 Tax=Orchesella dallaii TaxID=48710 RepID=A0ABP1REB0_9HEXA